MQQIWSATGRRKRASAQVRIASPGTGTIQINQVDAQIYLQGKYPTILKHLQIFKLDEKCDGFIQPTGGTLTRHADAIRHGCARALC